MRTARRHNKSWAEIATRLGVARQSAWEKWRELDEPAAAPPQEDVTSEVQRRAAAELAARAHRRRSTVVVPNVIGMSFDDARQELLRHGLVAASPDPDGPSLAAEGWPQDVVTDQSPESGAKIPRESSVRLWLDRGGGGSGVREPRRPKPDPRSGRAMNYDISDAATG